LSRARLNQQHEVRHDGFQREAFHRSVGMGGRARVDDPARQTVIPLSRWRSAARQLYRKLLDFTETKVRSTQADKYRDI
jgi:hypothetical protein